jgi:hypothetical protein
MFRRVRNNDGSILIVVLWTLIMISYLVGNYLIHNRSKTGTAMNLLDSFRQRNAITSLIHLIRTDEWKAGVEDYTPEEWVDMEVAGVVLRFRLDDESGRININTAGDDEIRQAMVDIHAEPDIEKANRLTDVLLDWRDTNDLVRAKGAEKREYMAAGLNYGPADGPFKAITEILMLIGMTQDTFWGNPGETSTNVSKKIDRIDRGWGTEDSGAKTRSDKKSVIETFTIFGDEIQRLSILIPLYENRARLYVVLFLDETGSLDIVERYSALLEG